MSANAYAEDAKGYQCPSWQAGWITTPPSPSSEYSSTPSSTQANNVTLSFTDANGNQVQSTNPDVETTVNVFDPAGRTYCSIDPSNMAAYLSAHSGGTYPYPCPTTPPTTAPTGTASGEATTIFDPAGRTLSTTDPDGDSTTYAFDAYGDNTTVTDADGHVTTNCYYVSSCASGAPIGGGAASEIYSVTRPTTSADPSGEQTTSTYYPGGSIKTSTTPAGKTTTNYDANGDTSGTAYSMTNSTYSAPVNVTYTYFQDGSRQTTTDGTGTTTDAYDGAGDLTSAALVAAGGTGLANKTMSYAYDAAGQIGAITYPTISTGAAPVATYAYNTAQQMSSVTDGAGNKVAFTYDQDGNETFQENEVSTSAPGGTSFTTWAYDAADLSIYSDTFYTAASASGITPQVQGAGSGPSGSGTSGSSSSPTQAQLAKQFDLKSSNGPNPFNIVTIPNGASAGVNGSATAQTLSPQTTCTPTGYEFVVFTGDGYGTRNADGDLTSETMTDGSNCGTVYSLPFFYTEDDASRVVYSGTTAQGSSTNNLAYDAAGNDTKMYTNIGSHGYNETTDNAGEVLTQTAIGSGSSSTFTYDTLGDQITDASAGVTATSSFNQIGQMVSYAKSGTTTTYITNGDGLETSNKVGTGGTQNQLVWDTANSSLPLLISDGNDYFIYGPGTTPVEQYYIQPTGIPSSNPTFLNYSADGLSTYILTNTGGAYTNGMFYDTFGVASSTFASSGTVFGYGGQYSDGYGSGLVNMRARWYEPGTGSFTSVDPDLATTNQPYEYAEDDPVNESDPTGLRIGSPEIVQVGPYLYRNGAAYESASELEAASANAESQGFPHGVSAFDRKPSSGDYSTASSTDIEGSFGLEKTGRNPNHYTIVLPNPVTNADAARFNTLFGRAAPPPSQPSQQCSPNGDVQASYTTSCGFPPYLPIPLPGGGGVTLISTNGSPICGGAIAQDAVYESIL